MNECWTVTQSSPDIGGGMVNEGWTVSESWTGIESLTVNENWRVNGKLNNKWMLGSEWKVRQGI